MDTMMAFAMGAANRGKELMIFDWDEAARIIKESNARDALAGLSGDLGNTCGTIFEDGKPWMDDYTYLASTWATPVLILIDCLNNKEVQIPCFIMQSQTEWNEHTKWPKSALDILEG